MCISGCRCKANSRPIRPSSCNLCSLAIRVRFQVPQQSWWVHRDSRCAHYAHTEVQSVCHLPMRSCVQRFQQGSNSVLEFNGGCGPWCVPVGAVPVGRHMPNHGQRVPLESQFTSSRHRQNLHSGRRILQSDGVHIGTDRCHTRICHSGPIPGTRHMPFCPLRHRPIPT